MKTRGDTHGRSAPLPPEKKISRTCVHSSAKWTDASNSPIAPNTAQLERPVGCEKNTKSDGGDRDQRPLEVAAVPEPQQAAADQQPGAEVEPEAVGTRSARVHRERDREIEEADEERHDGRPAAAVREQVGDQDPAGEHRLRDEQRKAEGADGDDRRDEPEQLEQQPRERGSRGSSTTWVPPTPTRTRSTAR